MPVRKNAAREGKTVTVYLNQEVMTGLKLVNEHRQGEGLPTLTPIQFANSAVVEKIRRELPEDLRLPLRRRRGDKKYYLSDDSGEGETGEPDGTGGDEGDERRSGGRGG